MTPVRKLKQLCDDAEIQQLFIDAARDKKDKFITSLINVTNASPQLQQCEPRDLVMECLKAAALGLQIDAGLGFAYIVPYKLKDIGMKPQYQIGYRGWMQLAQNTGRVVDINAAPVREGIEVVRHFKSGRVDFIEPEDRTKLGKVIGYFGYLKLDDPRPDHGFEKTIYWTNEEIIAHAKQHSKAYQYDLKYDKKSSLWSTNFEAMALKTLLLRVLKYCPASTEMEKARRDEAEAAVVASQAEIDELADQGFIEMDEQGAGDDAPF